MRARGVAVLLLLAGSLTIASEPWLDVPFVRQEREGCGSAAASMVMRYWMAQGAQVEEEAADPAGIQRQLHSPDAQGIYGSALRRYFEQHGFSAFIIKAEMADLELHLSRGRPLIVCLQIRNGVPLHYVVLVGIDSEKDQFIVHDPARGRLIRQKGSSFRKAWNPKGNWTLLAVPKSLP